MAGRQLEWWWVECSEQQYSMHSVVTSSVVSRPTTITSPHELIRNMGSFADGCFTMNTTRQPCFLK